MNTLRTTGRRMVFWGALLLLAWSAYELFIRFEEMVTWLSPVHSLVADKKITWLDYFQRVNWSRLRTHLFLLVCALFAIYALLSRKNTILGLIAIPIAVLLAIFSLGRTPLMSANLWQKLKLIPLVLVAVGSLLGFMGSLQKKKREQADPPVPYNQAKQYDPFNIKRQ